MTAGKAGLDRFGSLGYYIDIGQFKRADYFAEKGGFLVIRFDEREVDVGRPDFQGEGGEAGTGTEVDDAGGAVASTQYPVPRTEKVPAQAELGRGTRKGHLG